MAHIGMHEAKTNLSKLVERAQAGEDIVIARNGSPGGSPGPGPRARARWRPCTALSRGRIHIAEDFDELPADIAEAFGARWGCSSIRTPPSGFLSSDQRLGERAREHLFDDTNRVMLSAAVVWEVAIKRSWASSPCPTSTSRSCSRLGFKRFQQASSMPPPSNTCPWHHRDPFDRLLVAQAAAERAALVSGDEASAAHTACHSCW